MNFLADKSYLALKPQVDANTPILPTVHIPLIESSIVVNPNIIADRRMKGLDWKSDDVLKGEKMVEGDFDIYADVNALAHVFNMSYLKGSTTGDGTDGYTHPFSPGEGDHYTLEIPRGDYAERYWGVRADKINLSFDDNKLRTKVTIKALGHWKAASLATALTGAGMTEAVFDQNGDLTPNRGLVVGDVIVVGGVELTLTSVDADGITVGFTSTAVTAAVGAPVYLKAQTPSFGTLLQPLTRNDLLVGVSDTSANADTAAASAATATPVSEIEIEFSNNLLEAMQSGIVGTGKLLNRVRECQIKLNRLFETPDQHRKWIEATKQAITFVFKGRFINPDFSTWELFTLKFHKVKLVENGEPLNVGELIFDEQNFEALYDAADTEAVEVEVINTIAGTTL